MSIHRFNKIFASAIAVALVATGCSKQAGAPERAPENKDLANVALAQVYIATVNASRNAVYVDGALTSGAVLTSGSVFPTAGTAYAFAVTGGLHNFSVRDTLRTTTQVPLSFPVTMDASKNYTIFVYDTISSPKQRTVETKIVPVTDSTCRIRIANFLYSKVDLPGIDIYSAVQRRNIATDVKITDVTEFIPYRTNITDTFTVRLTGTTTDLINSGTGTNQFIRIILTPRQKRYYTFVFRGSYTSVATTAAQTRMFNSFTNY